MSARAKEAEAFACPRCGMDSNHEPGFFCECGDVAPERREVWNERDHGESTANPCAAWCRRCGWAGVLPHEPVRMPEWMSGAIAAKWRPPAADLIALARASRGET